MSLHEAVARMDDPAAPRIATYGERHFLRAVWSVAGTDVTVRTCITLGIDPEVVDSIAAMSVMKPAGVQIH
ncbi:hypothetical protein RGI145_19580 [Roseomonas gilardii]|uniref:Uncharacterized protein n=1 Tax=Roseomonas gilardii TaxID=257708 RepID=A0A1L7ALE7_9PROT|nr:hypothetical protein [Roseomonas gilardii]APT59549.1 hypothetical protein RGI145_19580 [Roseomonas gilardii]